MKLLFYFRNSKQNEIIKRFISYFNDTKQKMIRIG